MLSDSHRDKITALKAMVPFPFLLKQSGSGEFEVTCPVNDMLEMAISSNMDELMAMGMAYYEMSKIFPSFSVKPTNPFEFDRESIELGQCINKALQAIPPEINSLYFTFQVESSVNDESEDDEDVQTYAISLYGADSFDEDCEWINEAQQLMANTFKSETLDLLYQKKTEINWDFEKVAFLENIILYSYAALLIAKTCKSAELCKKYNILKRFNIIFGVETNCDLIPYQKLDLTNLFMN